MKIRKLRQDMFVDFICITYRVATWSGNQKKSGKTKKNDKSQVKMGVFEKSQEKIFKNI